MTQHSPIRRKTMADRIFGEEDLKASRWRAAVEAVPRETFLGEAVYRDTDTPEGTVWNPVWRRSMSAQAWLELVYQDETWVTQVGGIAAIDATEGVKGSPTSSSTMPSLVVTMLEVAGIGDGETVLEVGTGTGYSTALMCARLGDEAVTSVEFDVAVAAKAKAALASADYAPTLVQGDGLVGFEKNAEYGRLISTCAVRHIPMPWMWQVRDGGSITTPLWGWLEGSVLANLTLDHAGNASGYFARESVAFMPARPHMPPPRPSALYLGRGVETESRIDPRRLHHPVGRFVAQLGAPSAVLLGAGDEIVLLDVATGSQAETAPAPDGGWVVRQHGPLRLWDAVEQSILTWQAAGSPHQSAFGLTVTREDQRVWLGAPDGPSWRLPV
ncbi:ATP-grasp peptide maturase system methyltransferase [Sphaerisporangium sp. NPDC051017]|uniref:ATP-grasp peptide maturase system methyltransferase n=1 Tax=Sphaerisporangium sp. NPDC051017 TaxID=3154636 RepID=UPI0034493F4E